MAKGGGGSGTQTVGIDPEFKPYLVDALSDVTAKYKADRAAGPTSVVAKMQPDQIAALEYGRNQARDMMLGRGLYDDRAMVSRDLQNLAGTKVGEAGRAGHLGSARSQRAMQGALADKADQWNINRRQVSTAGRDLLGKTGSAWQQYEQSLMDAPHTMASRYFGYLGNAPQQTKTDKSGGK